MKRLAFYLYNAEMLSSMLSFEEQQKIAAGVKEVIEANDVKQILPAILSSISAQLPDQSPFYYEQGDTDEFTGDEVVSSLIAYMSTSPSTVDIRTRDSGGDVTMNTYTLAQLYERSLRVRVTDLMDGCRVLLYDFRHELREHTQESYNLVMEIYGRSEYVCVPDDATKADYGNLDHDEAMIVKLSTIPVTTDTHKKRVLELKDRCWGLLHDYRRNLKRHTTGDHDIVTTICSREVYDNLAADEAAITALEDTK